MYHKTFEVLCTVFYITSSSVEKISRIFKVQNKISFRFSAGLDKCHNSPSSENNIFQEHYWPESAPDNGTILQIYLFFQIISFPLYFVTKVKEKQNANHYVQKDNPSTQIPFGNFFNKTHIIPFQFDML